MRVAVGGTKRTKLLVVRKVNQVLIREVAGYLMKQTQAIPVASL